MLPDKPIAIAAIRDVLADELATVTRVAEMAQNEASSDETRQEGKYDTRATEASYLARGQAVRVAELRRILAWFDVFDVLAPATEVRVGALVQLAGDLNEIVLLVPIGGAQVTVEGQFIRAISPASPLGRAMMDLEAEDAFEVRTPGGLKEIEVVEVR